MRDIGVDAPRVTTGGKPVTIGAGYEAMWLAMKALREFDADELVQAASAGGTAVSVATALDFVKFLTMAGYLAIAAPAVNGKSRARYRFIRSRNTGPRPPIVGTKKDVVIDGNTGAVVWQRNEGEKECKNKT
jgi:hypothetical protein